MASTRRTRGKTTRPKKRRSTRQPQPTAAINPMPLSATLEAKPTPSTNCLTRQAIAEAAYFLWQQRGGNEIVNWLEAEAMLKQQAGLTR